MLIMYQAGTRLQKWIFKIHGLVKAADVWTNNCPVYDKDICYVGWRLRKEVIDPPGRAGKDSLRKGPSARSHQLLSSPDFKRSKASFTEVRTKCNKILWIKHLVLNNLLINVKFIPLKPGQVTPWWGMGRSQGLEEFQKLIQIPS